MNSAKNASFKNEAGNWKVNHYLLHRLLNTIVLGCLLPVFVKLFKHVYMYICMFSQITDAQKYWVEKETKEQAKTKLWFYQRAGRITASNFKAAARTDQSMPSISLIKRICYPLAFGFSNEATRLVLHSYFLSKQ